MFSEWIKRQVVWMLSCSDSAVALRRPLTRWWWNGEGGTDKQSRNPSFLFPPQFCFLGWAQHYCARVIHLEYANSWQCICLLVLDLPLGGRSPTQLRSLSAVCLQTPVILPHSATLRQSHFSTPHPLRLFRGSWDGMRMADGERCEARTNDEGTRRA